MSLDVTDAYLTVDHEVPTVVSCGNQLFELLKNLPGQRTSAKDWFNSFHQHLIDGLSIELLTEAPALFLIPAIKPETRESHGGNRGSGGGGLCHVDDMFAIGPTGASKRVGDCVKSNFKCTLTELKQVGDDISFLKCRRMWISDGLLGIIPSPKHVETLATLLGVTA